jgi:hypothetical protein
MLLVDAHVHIHECFEFGAFFDAAYGNFCYHARQRGTRSWTAFLLLAECAKQSQFRRLQEKGSSPRCWRVLATEEPISLRLEREGRPDIGMYVVAGRQIVTKEKLEVLALLSGSTIEDGKPLGLTVTAVREAGGLPALPWGAGKWLGGRKRILTRYLERDKESDLFLADNGCRPFFWPLPLYARKAGLQILAGSDPLPFPWEERRAGSFGFSLQGEIDEHFPATSLGKLLRDRQRPPKPYGRPETFLRFFRNQAAMQIRKNF